MKKNPEIWNKIRRTDDYRGMQNNGCDQSKGGAKKI